MTNEELAVKWDTIADELEKRAEALGENALSTTYRKEALQCRGSAALYRKPDAVEAYLQMKTVMERALGEMNATTARCVEQNGAFIQAVRELADAVRSLWPKGCERNEP